MKCGLFIQKETLEICLRTYFRQIPACNYQNYSFNFDVMYSVNNQSECVFYRQVKLDLHYYGEVSEWLKVHAWKACVGASLPGGELS